jgi:hypothetical protein
VRFGEEGRGYLNEVAGPAMATPREFVEALMAGGREFDRLLGD